VAVWPGFNVIGNVPDARVNPVPVTVAPLMVKAAVPVELRMTVFVAGVFTVALPKARLVILVLSVDTGTVNARAKVSVTLPAVAVRIAVCAVETGVTFTVNWALLVPVCTSAAGPVVTAGLLLDRTTLKPGASAGPLSVSVQRSVPVPPIDALAQVKSISCGPPLPLSATTVVLFAEELLVIVN
jgi:hypothetical protein